MTKNSKDILIALVCMILTIFFLAVIVPVQIPLPKFSGGGTTPRAIPKVCCWIILAMAAIMLIRTFLNDKNCFQVFAREIGLALKQKHTGLKVHVLLIYALSVLYYWGYTTIGFIITTLVIFPFYAYTLGCRKLVPILATDITLTFVVYYFFAIFMKCYLPGWAPF